MSDDDELRALVERARDLASGAGPLHGLWDTISDAEEILAGRPSRIPRAVVAEILRGIPGAIDRKTGQIPPVRGRGDAKNEVRQVPERRIKLINIDTWTQGDWGDAEESITESARHEMINAIAREIAERLVEFRKIIIRRATSEFGTLHLTGELEVIVPETPAENRDG